MHRLQMNVDFNKIVYAALQFGQTEVEQARFSYLFIEKGESGAHKNLRGSWAQFLLSKAPFFKLSMF